MYKKFRTATGKRMKVAMTEEEIMNHYAFEIVMFICAMFMAFLVWEAL